MITAAITAAIVAVLSFFGIPPGPYIAGVAIAVKITLVALIALISWRAVRKKRRRAELERVEPPAAP